MCIKPVSIQSIQNEHAVKCLGFTAHQHATDLLLVAAIFFSSF